jgi:hypothetical protein
MAGNDLNAGPDDSVTEDFNELAFWPPAQVFFICLQLTPYIIPAEVSHRAGL